MVRTVTRLIVVFTVIASSCARAADSIPVVVYDLEMIDHSLEGRHPDHEARIELTTRTLRNLFETDGRFRLVDPAPASEEIDRLGPLHGCNGCEVRITRELGARFGVLSRLQKVSSLILGMAITIVDAQSGQTVAMQQVSIRGDRDESWTRGIRYLFENKLDLAALATDR